MRKVKIVSTAKYLPKRVVGLEEISKLTGRSPEWITEKTGVIKRHYVLDETSPQMGAIVAKEALKKAGLEFKKDIDLLICASGTMAQPIPCTASLIQYEMGEGDSGIPAFDINTTCLSFVTAFDMVSHYIASGIYSRVLIVSTEIASVGLNYNEPESSILMGDGAAAVIVEACNEEDNCGILSYRMETYSSHHRSAVINSGGTTMPPSAKNVTKEDMMFKMDGPRIFKAASQVMDRIVGNVLSNANLTMNDIDVMIPHQGSKLALSLVIRRLKITKEKCVIRLHEQGNTIAAAIPMALHDSIESGMIKRGQNVLLLGTSAGFSMGVMIFKY